MPPTTAAVQLSTITNSDTTSATAFDDIINDGNDYLRNNLVTCSLLHCILQ